MLTLLIGTPNSGVEHFMDYKGTLVDYWKSDVRLTYQLVQTYEASKVDTVVRMVGDFSLCEVRSLAAQASEVQFVLFNKTPLYLKTRRGTRLDTDIIAEDERFGDLVYDIERSYDGRLIKYA